MMRRRLLLIGLIGVSLVGAVGCSDTDTDSSAPRASLLGGVQLLSSEVPRDLKPRASSKEIAALVGSNAEFATDLYRKLSTVSDDNLVLGPQSISTDLAMVFSGARGTTAAAMADVLHLGLPSERIGPATNALDSALVARNSEAIVLDMANQLWGQKGLPFLPAFTDGISRNFGAPVAVTDFAQTEDARASINGWVSELTHEKIPELFPKGLLDASTKLVLVNAMYLNAQWYFPFNSENTLPQPFTRLDGSTVEVPIMHFNEYLPSARSEDWQAVELPYSGEELSMVASVNSSGAKSTEAAAATGSAMRSSHGPTVTVDRPFLFVVRDQKTGAILFLGRVTDPSKT